MYLYAARGTRVQVELDPGVEVNKAVPHATSGTWDLVATGDGGVRLAGSAAAVLSGVGLQNIFISTYFYTHN